MSNQILWQDRKRPIFGLPLSFTKYTLTSGKILCDFGILNRTQEEIWLYRIVDVTLKRTLLQRIFGVGTIEIYSGDKSTPIFAIKDIKKPIEIKEAISQKIEQERNNRRVNANEFLDTPPHGPIPGGPHS